MLKIIGVDLSGANLEAVNENSTIGKVGDNKVYRLKVSAKIAKSKSNKTAKSKGKNSIKPFSTKSQTLI